MGRENFVSTVRRTFDGPRNYVTVVRMRRDNFATTVRHYHPRDSIVAKLVDTICRYGLEHPYAVLHERGGWTVTIKEV